MDFGLFQSIYGNRNQSKYAQTIESRAERIKHDGSEYFQFDVPAIAATEIGQYEIATQFPRAKKYLPLDYIEVSNNDTVNLTLFLNGGMVTLPVPAGSFRIARKYKIWQFGIRNDDAVNAITADSVDVVLRRMPRTMDDVARGL